MYLRIIISLISLLLSLPNWAYVDAFVDTGYANIKTSFDDSLDLLKLGIGMTCGYGQTFFVGGTGQYTSFLRIVGGNDQLRMYKNQKMVSVTPVVGIRLGTNILKFNYSGFGYVLFKETKSNVSARSHDVQGIGITWIRLISDNIALGAAYEQRSFEQVSFQNAGDWSGSLKTSSKLFLASFVFAYVF